MHQRNHYSSATQLGLGGPLLGRLFIEHKGELALAVALSVSQVACNSQSPVESETTSQVRQVSQEQFRAGIVVHGSGASNTEEALTPAIADQYLRVETAERKLLERAEAATFTDGEREHSYMKVRPLVLPTHPVHDKIGEFDRHHLGWPIAAMQGERILVLYTAEECHAGSGQTKPTAAAQELNTQSIRTIAESIGRHRST